VLLDDWMRPVVVGFRLAKGEERENVFPAPEQEKETREADVWALGKLVLGLCLRRMPRQDDELPRDRLHRTVIEGCCRRDPRARITAAQAAEMLGGAGVRRICEEL
jgi:hypothetical protein